MGGLLGEERGDFVSLDGEVLSRILQIAIRLLEQPLSISGLIGLIVEYRYLLTRGVAMAEVNG